MFHFMFILIVIENLAYPFEIFQEPLRLGTVAVSDRPKFGSVPVPAEITTEISVPVSVPAKFGILVLAGILVQK
jgi:hypothetical protein